MPRPKTPGGINGALGDPNSTTDKYQALFTLFGTFYGYGDGLTTFNLPDLRGRKPVGVDSPGPYPLGQKSGDPMTVIPLPAHTHDISHTHTVRARYFNTTSTESSTTGAIRVTNVGSNDPTGGTGNIVNGETWGVKDGVPSGSAGFDSNPSVNTEDPYLVLTALIKL